MKGHYQRKANGSIVACICATEDKFSIHLMKPVGSLSAHLNQLPALGNERVRSPHAPSLAADWDGTLVFEAAARLYSGLLAADAGTVHFVQIAVGVEYAPVATNKRDGLVTEVLKLDACKAKGE